MNQTTIETNSADGFLDAWLFDGEGGARKISHTEFSARTLEKREWIWIHANYAIDEVQAWAKEETELSESTVSALLADETRPRCEVIDDGLMLFLRGVNLNPGASPEDMVSIRLWLNSHRIMTLRQRRLLSIDDIREAIKKKAAPQSPGDFVVLLIDKILDNATTVTEALNDKVDELESSLDTAHHIQQREQLADIHRQAITLRRFLAPQRDAVARLITLGNAVFNDEHRIKLREDTDRLTRIVEGLIAARERATVVQELIANHTAEQTNRRMYVLSIISAVFLPLTFVTGLLGINVGGIPGAQSEWGFLVALGLVVGLAVGILAFFRYSRWY